MNLFSARILYTNTSVTLDEYFAFKYSPVEKCRPTALGLNKAVNRAIQTSMIYFAFKYSIAPEEKLQKTAVRHAPK